MVVTAEQARKKAEARRQRILAKSADRLNVVSKGMASKEAENNEPGAAAERADMRRRRYQLITKKDDEVGDDDDDDAKKQNNEEKSAKEIIMPPTTNNNNNKSKPPMDPSIKTTSTYTTAPLNYSSSSSKDGGKSTSLSTKSTNVNFLSSYEEMIRQQDHEYDATTKHLRGVFDWVQYSGRSNNGGGGRAPQDGRVYNEGRSMLTYSQIRRCLLRMGITWNRSLPPLMGEDDNVSITSWNSSSGTSRGGGSAVGRTRDIILTDAQLIMLLTALVEAEERYRAGNDNNDYDDEGIYFPEFIQCYQLIVAGMQSLQILDVDEDVIKAQIVDRVKERTFGLIRPFGPNTNLYSEKSKEEEGAADETAGGDGLLPSSKRSGLSAKGKSMRENNTKGGGLDENEMKSLIQSKDATLAMILQDHETEMNALAKGMDALRSTHARTLKLMKLRRGLLIGGATILCVGLLTTIIIREHQRNGNVVEGITALRGEVERKANAKTIAKLSEKRDVWEEKVDNTEATMRYLVNRNKGIDASVKELEAEIESVDMKYWIDVTEIQRCVVQELELGEELIEESFKKEEMDEELGWCQSRSRVMEKELNTLEHASTDQWADEDDSGMTGDQTLQLEMKYNKSIRHAVTARQAYSAAAGLVVSTMIHQLVPIVIKLFAPKPVQMIVESPKWRRFFHWSKRNKRAELAVVDGIFGGSAAFLVIRAIALFIFS